MRIVLAALLCVTALSACIARDDCGALEGAQRLQTQPQDPVALGSRSFLLRPGYSRDGTRRMIDVPPRTSVASLLIRSEDGQPFAELQPVCVRVTGDSEVWQTKLNLGEHRPDPFTGATMTAWAGSAPYWPDTETVHFVVWLRQGSALFEVDLGRVTISTTI